MINIQQCRVRAADHVGSIQRHGDGLATSYGNATRGGAGRQKVGFDHITQGVGHQRRAIAGGGPVTEGNITGYRHKIQVNAPYGTGRRSHRLFYNQRPAIAIFSNHRRPGRQRAAAAIAVITTIKRIHIFHDRMVGGANRAQIEIAARLRFVEAANRVNDMIAIVEETAEHIARIVQSKVHNHDATAAVDIIGQDVAHLGAIPEAISSKDKHGVVCLQRFQGGYTGSNVDKAHAVKLAGCGQLVDHVSGKADRVLCA